MRIGIVGHFAQGSFSECLTKYLNGELGQTIYPYPINNYPSEYYNFNNYDKRFPLCRIINGDNLEYIIVVQGYLGIHNDINIPVLYYSREPGMNYAIDRFKVLALRGSAILQNQEYIHEGLIVLLPAAVEPGEWLYDLQKDLFICTVSRDWIDNRYVTSTDIYRDLIQRSQHILINYEYTENITVSVRALEALEAYLKTSKFKITVD